MNHHHHWAHSSTFQGVPPNAVVGGHDADGSTIYVGRAYYEGDHMPAKVIPGKHFAHISFGGEEISVEQFDVLCGHNYYWVHCEHGNVPYNAVSSGTTASGEPLFIGRGHYEGSLTVGKIHPTHHCLYIPFRQREHRIEHYEVLIKN